MNLTHLLKFKFLAGASAVAGSLSTQCGRMAVVGVARPWHRSKCPDAAKGVDWRASTGNTVGFAFTSSGGTVAATLPSISIAVTGFSASNVATVEIGLPAITVSVVGDYSPNAVNVILPSIEVSVLGTFTRRELFCEARRPDLGEECMRRPDQTPSPIRRAPECPDQFVCDCV
jgi:hypothetical protein